jgi:N-carbamoyl-L-amino-acid hydrolase
MEGRADALLAAAEVAIALEGLARRCGGRATTGRLDLQPGVPTATAGRADLFTDLRHEDAEALERMHTEAGRISKERAASRGVGVERRKIWAIEPRAFDPRLAAAAREACEIAGGSDFAMPSGALHDAGELAPLVPTAMIFCASRRGLSHCPEEDSSEEDLECAIRAFEILARSATERSDLL